MNDNKWNDTAILKHTKFALISNIRLTKSKKNLKFTNQLDTVFLQEKI